MNAARTFGWIPLAVSLACAACGGPTQTGPETARDARALEAMRAEAQASALERAGEEAAGYGDLTRAEQYFVAAARGGGDQGRLTRKLVYVCVVDERYPVAAKYAEDHLARHPGDAEVRYALGVLRSALGDDEGARADLERVVRDRPALADAHYALAEALDRDDEARPRAEDHYRAYLRLAPRGAHAPAARTALERGGP